MNVRDLQLIVHIADSGSVTGGATQLNMTPATASAALKKLEQQLGVSLFNRSTRGLQITALGEQYLIHCREALVSLNKAKAAINQKPDMLSGTIRISAASDFGRHYLLRWVDEFITLHPQLQVQLLLSDSMADFYHDRVDVALRYGPIEDSSLVAFKITDYRLVLCASPEYLEKMGSPNHPEELINHNCLRYMLAGIPHNHWSFQNQESLFKVKVDGNRVANDADLVRRWAIAGKGVALKSRLDMADALINKQVVELLPQFQTHSTLSMICAHRSQITPAISAFREFLREKCRVLLDKVEEMSAPVPS